jgi:hypothetical protein
MGTFAHAQTGLLRRQRWGPRQPSMRVDVDKAYLLALAAVAPSCVLRRWLIPAPFKASRSLGPTPLLRRSFPLKLWESKPIDATQTGFDSERRNVERSSSCNRMAPPRRVRSGAVHTRPAR